MPILYQSKACCSGLCLFLTYLTPFTYGIQEDGGLVSLDDEPLIAMGRAVGTAALMHLSTLTESGKFFQ